jgi:hypothetical protein
LSLLLFLLLKLSFWLLLCAIVDFLLSIIIYRLPPVKLSM